MVGGHTTATGQIKVLEVTQAPNAQGVYKAKVAVADPSNTGQFLVKTNNEGISTMFPDHWTTARIKVEVDVAFSHRIPVPNKPGMWQGTTPSGVNVAGYLSPNTTVYPLLGGLLK